MRPLVTLLVLLGLAFSAACDQAYGDFGKPTPLLPGEAPLSAICRLRSEFEALPEPVHTGFVQHRRRTFWKFAVGWVSQGPYWEIQPTEATRRFTRAHSRLEIVAALGPYVEDPRLGPKAVAVLSALPVAERQALMEVQGFAWMLAEHGGREPGSRPRWDDLQRRDLRGTLLALYGLSNAGLAPSAGTAPTLEGAITEVLTEMNRPQPLAFSFVDVSDQHEYPDWNAVLARAPMPTLSPEFRAFMDRWPREWLVTVLFPYSLRNDPFGASPREKLVWILGRQGDYWPFSTANAFGADRKARTRAFEDEVLVAARAVCPRARPTRVESAAPGY